MPAGMLFGRPTAARVAGKGHQRGIALLTNLGTVWTMKYKEQKQRSRIASSVGSIGLLQLFVSPAPGLVRWRNIMSEMDR